MSTSAFNESDVARQKPGQPTGGQFAEKEKGASGLALTPAPATADEAGTRLEEAMRALNDSQQWPLASRGWQLWVRGELAEARPELAALGIKKVGLASWEDGGCYVDWYETADGERSYDVYEATPEQQRALDGLTEVATAQEISAALGQPVRQTVSIDTVNDPEGLYDAEKLATSIHEHLAELHEATRPRTKPEPGHKAQWAAGQALASLRYGTDLSDPDDDDDVQTAIADAMANLRHLAAARGLDFDDAVRMSAEYEAADLEDDAISG